jgi:hypothetical protein
MKIIIFLTLLFTASFTSFGQQKDYKLNTLNCQTIDSAHGEELVRISREIKKENYEEMCSVRKGKGRFQLLTKDGKNGSKEIVCVVVGDEGNGLFLRLGLTETKKKPDDQ